MSVYKKLQEVQNATRKLAPNATGQTGAATYGYVAGSKLLGCIRPIMDKVGLILTQEVIGCENKPMIYQTRGGEKTEMFTTLHIRFTWIDSDDGSKMENEFYANGMNAWDKGLGSALTYAERYYLMKLFHIATDEDDVDALVKEEAISQQPQQAAPQQAVQEQVYQPMAEGLYQAYIAGAATGRKNVEGVPCRKAWIDFTHAGKKEIKAFDEAVAEYKINNNIK